MFQIQRKRFFPLPDYDLNEPERVIVTVKGQILDERWHSSLNDKNGFELGSSGCFLIAFKKRS